ncbi:MAG: DUF2974 domain-containing protein [Bacilli bacterium]|nr:DUF2974 domain-containing protein [Bacilli bacterium]
MNIFDYIDKYGNYSFNEKEFNDIDNLIFSSLIYIDLDKYVSSNLFSKRSIYNIGKDFFRDYDIKSKSITATKVGINVLKIIMNKDRYKNLLLYNYSYIGDINQQFSAVTIDINSNLVYVSFEGTDQLISGWKEDFMMSYKFPVSAQKLAINYVNKFFTFGKKKIILGGHSKGGNLAMAAGMYANMFVKNKIVRVYNNDGPGFRESQFNSIYYNRIKDKLVYIIPNYSVVGLLLKHSDNYIVVKSLKKGIYAHNLANWMVKDDKLLTTELSSYSSLIDKTVFNWLEKHNDSERENFVNKLFLIFDKANIIDLIDVMNNKKLIFNLIRNSKELDNKTRNMLMDFIYLFLNLFKETKISEIESFFHNNLNKNMFIKH